MVSCDRILETATREKVDAIGLSGLITPSLEEMSFVAGEMQRQGFKVPLLIGGATTSRVHTAVKIEPRYKGTTVHVLDASRAVGVVGRLLSDGLQEDFSRQLRAEYQGIRESRGDRQGEDRRIPLETARRHRLAIDWTTVTPPRPRALGVTTLADYPLEELVERIDWTPFFQTWELPGRYPAILEDAKTGAAARALYADARALLDRIVSGRLLQARAALGLFPANSDPGDDIILYTDDLRTAQAGVIHTLRQQMAKPPGRPNLALADFVAPRDSAVADYVGLFAVTAGIGLDTLVRQFEAANDDYSSILAKALADRLAEAFAERLHERVRREFWGYAPDEQLSNDDLVQEKYQGIRPAPGYPSCPDHSEKPALFALVEAESRARMQLTESFAMLPAASVSGYYFWNPAAQYFGLGRIGKDQVEDYARRKGMSVAELERWLAPNLGYER